MASLPRRSGWALLKSAGTRNPRNAKILAATNPPTEPKPSMANPATADPKAAPTNCPEPIQPYASAVSENFTLEDTMANMTASAGAIPAPAISRAKAIHQKSRMAPAIAIPIKTTSMRAARAQGPIARPPSASPPMMDPIAQMERTIPASGPP